MKKTYSYLALGDSYTIGEKVLPQDNFPNQVVKRLALAGIHCNPPRIIAKTGWTTDELAQAISTKRLRSRYDFVTLLIGVNNQYRGRSVANYIPEFEDLLQKAILYSGNNRERVFVIAIPDWSVTPFAKDRDQQMIAKEIDDYNAANQSIADLYQVPYVNITPGTRQAATDSSLLAADGLHPSAKEYTRWAEAIAACIRTLLQA